MPTGTDVGYYTLPVILSFQNVDRQVNQSLGQKLGLAGKKAGVDYGRQLAGGIKSSESQVKSALDKYSRLYNRQQDAIGKVSVEQAKLTELQKKGITEGARLTAQTEKLEKAQRDETQAIKIATDAMREYERATKDAAKATGSMGDEADSAAKKLAAKMRGGMAGAGAEGASSFMTGLAAGIGGAAGRIPEMFGKTGGILGALSASVASVGVIAGTVLVQNFIAGVDKAQQRANFAASLGLSPEAAKQAAEVAAKAYANNFGTSLQDNLDTATVAIQGHLVSGATDPALQQVIQQIDTVRNVVGATAQEVVASAKKMVDTGLATSVTQALDLITAAGQKGLNVNGDLLDTVNEYSIQYKKLGLTGAEALGTIAQLQRAGVRDADVAADLLKEFSIRVVDGSTLTTAAFEELGFNAEATAAEFAKGGEAAKAMGDKVIDKFNAMPDSALKAQVGVALFGTQFEDTGDAIKGLDLSSAGKEFEGAAGTVERAAETMGETTAASVESMKRSIQVSLDEMQLALAQAFGPTVKEWANVISEHKPEIIGFFFEVADASLLMAKVMVGGFGTIVGATGDMVAGIGNVSGAWLKFQAIGADLRGDHETARRMREDAEAAFGWGKEMQATGQKMKDAAGDIDGVRDKLRGQREEAQKVFRLYSKEGAAATIKKAFNVTTVEELRAKVEKLGGAVEELPDGQIRVTADTEEVTAALEELDGPDMLRSYSVYPIDENAPPGHEVVIGADTDKAKTELDKFVEKYPFLAPGSKTVINVDANGNGTIPGAAGQAPAGPQESFGLSSADQLGSVGWVNALSDKFGLKAQTRAGHQTTPDIEGGGAAPNPQGLIRGIDWGFGDTDDKRLAFAKYLYANPHLVEQLIYMDPRTGEKYGIAGGKHVGPGTDQPDYYAANWAGHTDHVHIRTSKSIPLPMQRGGGIAGFGGGDRIPILAEGGEHMFDKTDVMAMGGHQNVYAFRKMLKSGLMGFADGGRVPDWDEIARKESGGDWSIPSDRNGGPYRGGLQILDSTWVAFGGEAYAKTANLATKAEQIAVAEKILAGQGQGAWPNTFTWKTGTPNVVGGSTTVTTTVTGGGYVAGTKDGKSGYFTPANPGDVAKQKQTLKDAQDAVQAEQDVLAAQERNHAKESDLVAQRAKLNSAKATVVTEQAKLAEIEKGEFTAGAVPKDAFPGYQNVAASASDIAAAHQDVVDLQGDLEVLKAGRAELVSARAKLDEKRKFGEKKATPEEKAAAQQKIDERDAEIAALERKLATAQGREADVGKGTYEAKDTKDTKKSEYDSQLEKVGELPTMLVNGLLESIGIGDVFPSLLETPMWKSIAAGITAFKGPIQGLVDGKLGIQQPGWSPGMAIPGSDTGSDGNLATVPMPFGLPGIDVPAPLPDEPHQGNRQPPGPVSQDNSVNINYNAPVGSDPEQVRVQQQRLIESRSIPRLPAGS